MAKTVKNPETEEKQLQGQDLDLEKGQEGQVRQNGTDAEQAPEQEPIVETKDGQKPEAKAGKAYAEKAAQIAKNYKVKTVWGTVDGRRWATSEDNLNRLPKGVEVEVYTFN